VKAESPDTSYLARPDGAGPFPGVVVVHEASGLNDNIRDICGRFAREVRVPKTCATWAKPLRSAVERSACAGPVVARLEVG
jgi:dienelactone hydrolase